MSYTYTPSAPKRKEAPPPPPHWSTRFLSEVLLLASAILLLVFGAVLWTYHPDDPGFSTSGFARTAPEPGHTVGSSVLVDGAANSGRPPSNEVTPESATVFEGRNWNNIGGQWGAWLADVCFFSFGKSVWLLWAVAVWTWLRSVRNWLRISSALEPKPSPYPPWLAYLGVILMLLSASALEWSRAYYWDATLPDRSGGALGYTLGLWGETYLGFNAMAVLLAPLFLYSLSLALGFSWDRLAQVLGQYAENLFSLFAKKREYAEDVRIGAQAQREREEEPPPPDAAEYTAPIIQPPTPQIAPRSDRVLQERQQNLFGNTNRLPEIDLLDPPQAQSHTVTPETLEMTSRLIEKKLKDFGVQVRVVQASPGPVITRYEFDPATGVKGSQIVNLSKDLARSLSLTSVRVIETIPGKSCMALELPNPNRQSIVLSEILGSVPYDEAKSLLTIGLGKDIIGNPVVADLAKMPHCLVAGTTGSGKSVGINAMILSLLYKAEPDQVRLLLIDPKMLEMSVYEGIPHLLAPVVTDMRQAAHGLNWCVGEMEKRYRLMSKLGVRNVAGYNQKLADAKAQGEFIYNPFSLTPEQPEPLESLPYIVVVIDELADLMMVVGKKIEELIARLAQKARAAGIHLILATQRPSVDVITGLIKANIPTRISFQVSSKIDSRTILDQMGAESLLGMGDMLYMPSGTGFPTRVHGAFVSDNEVHRVVSYLKAQGEAQYIEGVLEGGVAEDENGQSLGFNLGFGTDEAGGEKDPMYDQAVAIVLKNRKASISLVQRHLKIGYNRAARLLEEMENAGMISAMSSNGQRDILVPSGPAE